MAYLVVLTCVSLNEPTKEAHFEFFHYTSREDAEAGMNVVKNDTVQEWKQDFVRHCEGEACPYKVGYIPTCYMKGFNRGHGASTICGDLGVQDDVFLVEIHTTYDFCFSASLFDLSQPNASLVLFEH